MRFLITIFRSPVWYGFISLKITGSETFWSSFNFFFFPGIPDDFQGTLSEYQKSVVSLFIP